MNLVCTSLREPSGKLSGDLYKRAILREESREEEVDGVSERQRE
uniref:Uncharacterized protein n=1 Tax=viral metagenome TaxID=1070528 RepID=A0A6C0JT46_9ZZZZ